jgi:hypothetical protein
LPRIGWLCAAPLLNLLLSLLTLVISLLLCMSPCIATRRMAQCCTPRKNLLLSLPTLVRLLTAVFFGLHCRAQDGSVLHCHA